MNEPDITRGTAPTTDDIANAGAGGVDTAFQGQQLLPDDAQTEQPTPVHQAPPRSDLGTNGQPHAQLLEDQELRSMHEQWKEIQAEFVDEPRQAVQDADALVAELMQRLAQMFASEREQLESRWSGGGDVSTEDLRHGLRRYRSFFERLLAA
jgi:hypothetical protein